MCSVVGCGSWRRSVQRFNLPEDPEKRLEWVQFLFEVNGQRLKESSWTDITICSEHFTEDCFENLTPTGSVQLRPSAVPSQCVRSEPEESPARCEGPVETTDVSCQCDDLDTYAVTSGCDHMQHHVTNTEKVELQQMEGKFVVNERCLLQLFCRKCPSCGCKLQMEKVTCGVLIVLNLQCLKCEYRNQWKSQVSASVPAAEDQHLTGGTEAGPTDDNPSNKTVSEIVTLSDEESDPSDDGEEGDEDEVSSDGEWNPAGDILLAEELTKDSEDETDEGEEEKDFNTLSLKINELCTECGSFFNIQKPHTCEHKIKPYSCNICGKRCVTEISLKNHSIIHNETYEHPCKYCHVTFKTRLDKLKHEQIHQDKKDPYKCPDCPQTFATNRERRVHLSNHRIPKEFKCGVCGMEFNDVHHLQRHSVVHTGLKPYKCSVCQRGFNQGSHLKSHMRLHTGERPYKCQHCDKCFNHNVSLKSHVQRYHSSTSGHQQKIDETVSDTGDTEENERKKDADSECENVDGQDTDEEVQKERIHLPKRGRRCTGRPKGRPKRNAEGNLVLPRLKEQQRSNTKTAKSKRLKKTGSSDEESEAEQSDSNISFDSTEEEEEEEEKETTKKSTGRTRRRPKNNSDLDFDAEEETKRQRYSSQNSGKGLGKRRGRPRKKV